MAINRQDWLRSVVPSGTVIAFAGSTAPSGWLLCDGSTISRSIYSALFSAIGSAHGSGNGSTTFHLPDYRGRFLRGVDGTAGNDPDKISRTAANTGGNAGNAVGSVQSDENKQHNHAINYSTAVQSGSNTACVTGFSGAGVATTQNSTGTESRPKNAAVNYLIKI